MKQYNLMIDKNRIPVLLPIRELDCDGVCDDDCKVIKMLNRNTSLKDLAEEYLYMVALDTKCNVLGVFEVAHGTVNFMITTPREIFMRAMMVGAVSIVLAHNHPSGNTNPSKEDDLIARRITKAGELLGIELLSFLIVGQDHYERVEVL